MDSEAIRNLAVAIREQTQAAVNPVSSVSAVSFKAPPFWTTNAKTWFLRVEAAFATHAPPITNDLTKFYHVLQLLDSSTSRRVQAIVENPPSNDKYEALKSALLDCFEPTQLQKDMTLLNLNGLGDKRPSEMLQYMKSLNSDPQTLFNALFLNQLPSHVRQILSQTPKLDLDSMAKIADRVMEVPALPSGYVSSVSDNDIHLLNEKPKDEIEINSFKKSPNLVKNKSQKMTNKFILCKYHSQFGNKAKRCEGEMDGKICPMNPGNSKASP